MRALDIASFVVTNAEKFGRPISNLKLQKILYFIHRDYLREYNEKLITDKEFEAWHYGAVIPRVYYEYILFCADPIVNQPSITLNLPEDRIEFLKERIAHYTLQKPWVLVELAHEPHNAWSMVYNESVKNIIPHAIIREEALGILKAKSNYLKPREWEDKVK